jgi:hypothetical protein
MNGPQWKSSVVLRTCREINSGACAFRLAGLQVSSTIIGCLRFINCCRQGRPLIDRDAVVLPAILQLLFRHGRAGDQDRDSIDNRVATTAAGTQE